MRDMGTQAGTFVANITNRVINSLYILGTNVSSLTARVLPMRYRPGPAVGGAGCLNLTLQDAGSVEYRMAAFDDSTFLEDMREAEGCVSVQLIAI
jgi:hypothetical protein